VKSYDENKKYFTVFLILIILCTFEIINSRVKKSSVRFQALFFIFIYIF